MLVIGDFKSLELNTCFYLSQDQIGIAELGNPDIDLHLDNQAKFGLPEKRIAKFFVFRLIFGGTAAAYCYDPDFNWISDKQKYWQNVIDAFYLKYQGVKAWHERLVLEAMETGRVVIPTGRFFSYIPYENMGELVWPRTTILNYPVQGLGADLMVLARVLMAAELKRKGLTAKIVCTVHDSLLYDCPKREVEDIAKVFFKVWRYIPKAFEKTFGVPYNVLCRVEVKAGPNWADMEEIKEKDLNAN